MNATNDEVLWVSCESSSVGYTDRKVNIANIYRPKNPNHYDESGSATVQQQSFKPTVLKPNSSTDLPMD